MDICLRGMGGYEIHLSKDGKALVFLIGDYYGQIIAIKRSDITRVSAYDDWPGIDDYVVVIEVSSGRVEVRFVTRDRREQFLQFVRDFSGVVC